MKNRKRTSKNSNGTFLPATIWLTGLVASGKTTLAQRLKEDILSHGVKNVILLDGEVVREHFKNFNFSTDDRNAIGIQKGLLAREYNKKGNIVIVTGIAHHKATREKIRTFFEKYSEIYLDCPPAACAKRDSKGHYKRAYRGEYEHFVGVTEPYQISDKPELILKTGEMSIDECAKKLFDYTWNFIQNNKHRMKADKDEKNQKT